MPFRNYRNCIYVLVNPLYAGYVKIGYASNLKERMSSLNTGMLRNFEVYAVYETPEKLADRQLHSIIDELAPIVRAKVMTGRKVQDKEFFKLEPEQVYGLLNHIAIMTGTEDRLHLCGEVDEWVDGSPLESHQGDQTPFDEVVDSTSSDATDCLNPRDLDHALDLVHGVFFGNWSDSLTKRPPVHGRDLAEVNRRVLESRRQLVCPGLGKRNFFRICRKMGILVEFGRLYVSTRGLESLAAKVYGEGHVPDGLIENLFKGDSPGSSENPNSSSPSGDSPLVHGPGPDDVVDTSEAEDPVDQEGDGHCPPAIVGKSIDGPVEALGEDASPPRNRAVRPICVRMDGVDHPFENWCRSLVFHCRKIIERIGFEDFRARALAIRFSGGSPLFCENGQEGACKWGNHRFEEGELYLGLNYSAKSLGKANDLLNQAFPELPMEYVYG